MNNTNTTNYLADPLWRRISRHELDDSKATRPLSVKLAEEQQWSTEFTRRVIEEYRRFVYLCCTSPQGASPSKTVDEVWHMHLTYTTDYWGKFCKETLQKELHHYPSQGGQEENKKHENWYRETLALYKATFNDPPPEDIWDPIPAMEINPEPIEIPTEYFSKIKNKWSLLLLLPFLLTILFFGKFIPFMLTGPEFLLFYLALTITSYIVVTISLHTKERRLETILRNTLTAYCRYEVMFLKGDGERIDIEVISELLNDEVLLAADTGFFQIDKAKAARHNNPLANALAEYNSDEISVDELKELAATIRAAIESKYQTLYMQFDNWYNQKTIPILVVLIGFARMVQGLGNNKPIALLVIMTILYLIACNILFKSNKLHSTCKFIFRGEYAEENTTDWMDQQATQAGILGFWLADTTAYNPNNRSSDGCSGGGGCSSGGGSCGGGCGGCGS